MTAWSQHAAYLVANPDAEAPTGVTTAVENYQGATAAGFGFEQPCYVEEGFAG